MITTMTNRLGTSGCPAVDEGVGAQSMFGGGVRVRWFTKRQHPLPVRVVDLIPVSAAYGTRLSAPPERSP